MPEVGPHDLKKMGSIRIERGMVQSKSRKQDKDLSKEEERTLNIWF